MLKITQLKVKDSDKLKQLAYAFVKKADELDHASQANARNALKEKSDPKVMNELLKIAIEVEKQLNYEVAQMKKNVNSQNVKKYPYDNEILNFLSDGADRCVWAEDAKLKMLGKKIRNLVSEYRQVLQYNVPKKDSKNDFDTYGGKTVEQWLKSEAGKLDSIDDLYNGKKIVLRYKNGTKKEVFKDSLKSFNVNGRVVKASSAMDAIKQVKDTDSESDLQFLIDDELQAIEGYKKVIAKTENPLLLTVLSHILNEETEHVEELRAAQAGNYKIDDSVKDKNINDVSTINGITPKHTAKYLWTWASPHEHEFASRDEFEDFYIELTREVNKLLTEGKKLNLNELKRRGKI